MCENLYQITSNFRKSDSISIAYLVHIIVPGAHLESHLAFVVEAHRRKDILKVVAIKFELGPMCPSLKCNDYFSEWVEKHHRRPVMFKLALGTTRATSDLCFNIQFHRFDQDGTFHLAAI